MEQEILQKPWEPVKVTQTENTIKVNLWGREYVFSDSVFPSEIITSGENILASPIELRTFFNDEEKKLCETSYLNFESSDTCCEFTVAQRADNVIVNARVRVEYDGLIRIKFCILPFWNEEWKIYGKEDSTYRLSRLFIDIPLKRDFSRMYHYYPNDGGSTIVLFTNDIPSGILPEEGLVVPFKPYTWLGWEDGGLSLCCESNKNIELSDKNRAMEYIVEDDRVILRVHLLDHMPLDWQSRKEMWADAALPIEFEYGIQATPVKPRRNERLTDYKIFHRDSTAKNHDYLFEEFEESEEKGRELISQIAKHGANYFLILGWTKIMNYWRASDDDKFQKFVDICHEYGVEPILYFGYEYATVMPDWFENAHKYLQKNKDGRLTDGWLIKPPHPWHRAYTMCLNSPYADVFFDGIVECMDRYGIKGIYLDGTLNPWECANEAHGCGYIDRDGNRQHTYPIFAVREFAKKLHAEIQKRNGVLYVHQSGTCTVPTMAFTDVVLNGESIMGKLRRKEVSLDVFRAELCGGNTGINTMQLDSEINGLTTEFFASKTLLHSYMPMPRIFFDRLDFAGRVWRAYESFDVSRSEFIGYWQENCPVKTDTEDIYTSCYVKDGEILAVVSNIGNDKKTFNVIASKNIQSVCEMLYDSPCEVIDGKVNTTLDADTVRMLRIKVE